MMRKVLAADWGRLFRNWEHVTPDADGFPSVGAEGAELTRVGAVRRSRSRWASSARACKEAPEFSNRKRKVVSK